MICNAKSTSVLKKHGGGFFCETGGDTYVKEKNCSGQTNEFPQIKKERKLRSI